MFRSRYNFFVDRPDGVLGYNSRTGSFSLLAKSVADVLRGSGEVAELPELASLQSMGFVHSGEEQDLVRDRFRLMRERTEYLHLTLVPTLDCNLSCPYCFQNKYRDSPFMSAVTQEATLAFIKQKLDEGRKEVSCIWFGGEPLLAKDIVLSMSPKIIDLVEGAGGHLHGGLRILTNALLLKKETAQELARAGLKRAQVSIDSLVFDGRSKRGVIDSHGNISALLRNVLDSREHIGIDIRLNVSADNISDMPEIMSILDAHGLRGTYGTARVHDHEEEAGAPRDNLPSTSCAVKELQPETKRTVTRKQYAKFEVENYFPKLTNAHDIVGRLKPKGHFCAATQGHMFVIDPAGNVSRCWHSAGVPAEAFMNVVSEANEPEEESAINAAWMKYTPLAYKTCSSCNVLPLCMGGCSHPRVFMDAKKPPCEAIKYQIQDCIDQVGKRLVLTTE